MNKTFNSMLLLNLFYFKLPVDTCSFVAEARGPWEVILMKCMAHDMRCVKCLRLSSVALFWSKPRAWFCRRRVREVVTT